MRFNVSQKILLLSLSIFLSACAGLNPNIGERTTDNAWNDGDYPKAFEMAKFYADKGQPWAQLRLGIFYTNGWGVKKDAKIAFDWYQKAAVQTAPGGWADGLLIGATGETGYFNQNSDALIAQYSLARLYFEGEGVEKDLKKSLDLINNVIEKSDDSSVFFCCEFSTVRSFTQGQFVELKSKIEKELANK